MTFHSDHDPTYLQNLLRKAPKYNQFTAHQIMSYPTIPTNFNYEYPTKQINNEPQDLQTFQSTPAYTQIQSALQLITQLVEFTPLPSVSEQSNIINDTPWLKSILLILDNYSTLIDQTPPYQPTDGSHTRFGNPSRRTWQDKIQAETTSLLTENIIQYYQYPNREGFVEEIGWYLLNSFGSKERLDYGTGHELNFLAFIIGLWRVRIIPNASISGSEGVTGVQLLILFSHYYDVVMKLIKTYNLEPAGSHGVWGLDDHFHLLYIIGSSQLTDPKTKITSTASGPSHRRPHIVEDEISPRLILNQSEVSSLAPKYLLFKGIQFINTVKPPFRFAEHSPILSDISQMKNWSKIQKGLVKMFQGEVVGKFPVVQHFWFGGVLLQWKSPETVNSKSGVTSSDVSVNSRHNTDNRSATVTPTPHPFNADSTGSGRIGITTARPHPAMNGSFTEHKTSRLNSTLQDPGLSRTRMPHSQTNRHPQPTQGHSHPQPYPTPTPFKVPKMALSTGANVGKSNGHETVTKAPWSK
ncbi:hypothetical protein WICPIJ_002761 [Wickerhamomyces pijperi]|uniref:Serine/threonine-protein phosphatase 2A activator n=1 Tax=Wickerhamomyces pijperi TaxID=599730 RepID=A0A9P8QB81_WICPI|nr:hypothetical protein WICPIJ_002761 [Wickerhamomyces pijperi]